MRRRHHPWFRTRRACCYRQKELQESNRRVANVPLSRRANAPCKFPRWPQERISLSLKARLSLFLRAITCEASTEKRPARLGISSATELPAAGLEQQRRPRRRYVRVA